MPIAVRCSSAVAASVRGTWSGSVGGAGIQRSLRQATPVQHGDRGKVEKVGDADATALGRSAQRDLRLGPARPAAQPLSRSAAQPCRGQEAAAWQAP